MNVICAAVDKQKQVSTIKKKQTQIYPVKEDNNNKKENLTVSSPAERIASWNRLYTLYCRNLKPVTHTHRGLHHKQHTASRLRSAHQASSSYRAKSCCFVSGTIMSQGLRVELNFCLSSLTYSENTWAQSYNEPSGNIQLSTPKFQEKTKQNKTALTSTRTHLWVLWISGFILLQQLHQRFVLVHLSQADSATHSRWVKLQVSVQRCVCVFVYHLSEDQFDQF